MSMREVWKDRVQYKRNKGRQREDWYGLIVRTTLATDRNKWLTFVHL